MLAGVARLPEAHVSRHAVHLISRPVLLVSVPHLAQGEGIGRSAELGGFRTDECELGRVSFSRPHDALA